MYYEIFFKYLQYLHIKFNFLMLTLSVKLMLIASKMKESPITKSYTFRENMFNKNFKYTKFEIY